MCTHKEFDTTYRMDHNCIYRSHGRSGADQTIVSARQGTLNPRPRDVKRETFQDSEFFDAEDLLQVKYEMLRLVEIDNNRSVRQRRHSACRDHPSIRHRRHFRKPVSPACCRRSGVHDPGTS